MNQPERQQPEPTPISSQVSAGQILSSRRQSWGISVEDIAGNLNLGVDIIEAIEQDNYDRLPGSTFVKGYIRSYAKLLELDADKVLETLDIVPEQLREIPSIKSSIRERGKTVPRTTRKSGGGFFKFLLVLLAVVGIALAAVNLLPKFGIDNIADIFQLPGTTDQIDTNVITLPESGSTNDGSGKKSALIRIE